MSADRPVVETSALEAVFSSGDGVGPVDLAIGPGERVLVLGPSGSGKSTLLRLLHGAVPHAIHAEVTGEVWISSRRVADTQVAELADLVGVVLQDPEAGVCLADVREEVAFPLENLAVDPATIGAAVDRALDRAGASSLRGRDTAQLSGGELQRIALAAAIAPGPRLLLLDEPTAMLDADGIAAVAAAIDTACDATGAACVLVEHRLDDFAGDGGVDGLPQRWIVLDPGGRVRYDGSPRELTAEAVRDLVASGCWLPLDLELPVLLDGVAGYRSGGLDEALQALAGRAVAEPAVPADPGPALHARGLAVARGQARRQRRPVLSGIDLQLRRGEVTAVVGANGSGKSTLLTCLAGLEPPLTGEVTGPRPGMVFQNPEHQFVASTVRAELAHGLPAAAGADVAAMLRRFRLEDCAGHNPYRLSGGQKRRVSLAAMLLHDRPYLFADEPGLGLDRPATIETMRALREAARQGRGVLFASHDLRAVAGYADRVLVLGAGRMLADTTPLHLLRRPELLADAGLRAPVLLRRLATLVDDDVELSGVLRELDSRAADLHAGGRIGVAS